MSEEKPDSKKRLDDYLKDDFNVEIYKDIANENTINPTAFFDWLYEMLALIEQSKGLPEEVRKVINRLSNHADTPSHRRAHIEPRYQLQALHLARLIRHRFEDVDGRWKNEDVRHCSKLIEIELERSLAKSGQYGVGYPRHIACVRFVVRRLKYRAWKQKIRELPDNKARYVYLVDLRAEARQEPDFNAIDLPTFDQDTLAEMKKLKTLMDLEPTLTESNSSVAQSKGGRPKADVSKIVWRGDVTQLVCLFEILVNEKRIITDAQWELIAEHFIREDGTLFKAASLKTLRQSAADSTRNAMQDIVRAAESTAQSIDEPSKTSQRAKKRPTK